MDQLEDHLEDSKIMTFIPSKGQRTSSKISLVVEIPLLDSLMMMTMISLGSEASVEVSEVKDQRKTDKKAREEGNMILSETSMMTLANLEVALVDLEALAELVILEISVVEASLHSNQAFQVEVQVLLQLKLKLSFRTVKR